MRQSIPVEDFGTVFLHVREAPEEKWGRADKSRPECLLGYRVITRVNDSDHWENIDMDISHLFLVNFVV